MDKTEKLDWLVNLNLFVIILVMFKYDFDNYIMLYCLFNALFCAWFHMNIKKKEVENKIGKIIDKCDKVKSQWD